MGGGKAMMSTWALDLGPMVPSGEGGRPSSCHLVRMGKWGVIELIELIEAAEIND